MERDNCPLRPWASISEYRTDSEIRQEIQGWKRVKYDAHQIQNCADNKHDKVVHEIYERLPDRGYLV